MILSIIFIHSIQIGHIIGMLPNDSQELPSEGNDNEFLPNSSHSYESMIKEHQERRSLMLNDQLLMPSAFSNVAKEH